MSTQAREQEIIGIKIQAFKGANRQTKAQVKGQAIIMKTLIKEAKGDIEVSADFCWKLEDVLNQGDFLRAKQLIRENEGSNIESKLREAGENIQLMLREVGEAKGRLSVR
jgi:ribosomal protein S20